MQNLSRACDKHLGSNSNLPLTENAQAIKLDSNVSCYNYILKETHDFNGVLTVTKVAVIYTAVSNQELQLKT